MNAIIISNETVQKNVLQSLIKEYYKEAIYFLPSENLDYESIQEVNPDVVFIDEQWLKGKGVYPFKKLENIQFQLVFKVVGEEEETTSIKFYELKYCLKSVDINEFKFSEKSMKAANRRYIDNEYQGDGFFSFAKAERPDKLALHVKDGIIYLAVSDIVRIESDGSYSTFYTSCGKRYISSKNIGEYENLLTLGGFYRIHKSHLVNINKVKKYIRGIGGFIEMEDGSVVEMARRKKEDFLRRMNQVN